MERVVFAGSWESFFAEFGLTSFDDFFNYPSSGRTSSKRKRHVSALNFEKSTASQLFFLKRFYYSHFGDMLFAFRNFGRFYSQAACEWKNASLLLDKGFGTYIPVCYGEQIKCGIERKSFFVTEKLQSQCFTDFVAQNWGLLAQPQKEKIIIALAKLIRKVHNEAISLPDLYVWHIFIKQDAVTNTWDLAFIDLHRMSQSVKSPNKKVKDLSRLYWSMSHKYLDDKLKDLLVSAYMGDDWTGSKLALVRTIQKGVNALDKRRKLKDY
jgi:hypothetical protein